MAEIILPDMLEELLRRVSQTDAFKELITICPYSEVYFQIHEGRFSRADIRIKGRNLTTDKEV